ncbi:MAG: hypothetical protein FJY56_12765 [Betaproteobacteria bacterium]|nr:hypothetical protein [Betaproteobacteria bacterium]
MKKASCHVGLDFQLAGSVLKGTVKDRWQDVTTSLDIDSDEPMAKIVAPARNAKGGCFAGQLIVNPLRLAGSITLRGQTAPFEAENS